MYWHRENTCQKLSPQWYTSFINQNMFFIGSCPALILLPQNLDVKYCINGPDVVFVSFCNHISPASIVCTPVNIPIFKVLIIVLCALRTQWPVLAHRSRIFPRASPKTTGFTVVTDHALGNSFYSCLLISCFNKCRDQIELVKERVYFRLQVIVHH